MLLAPVSNGFSFPTQMFQVDSWDNLSSYKIAPVIYCWPKFSWTAMQIYYSSSKVHKKINMDKFLFISFLSCCRIQYRSYILSTNILKIPVYITFILYQQKIPILNIYMLYIYLLLQFELKCCTLNNCAFLKSHHEALAQEWGCLEMVSLTSSCSIKLDMASI